MNFVVISAVAEIMQDESIPIHFKIDVCKELMRQNGLFEADYELLEMPEEIAISIPIQEFQINAFSQKIVCWEVLN